MISRDKDLLGIVFLILMVILCLLATVYIIVSDLTTYKISTVGNISFDLFGMVICTIIHLTMFIDRRNEISMPYFMCILLLEVLLLFWDIVRWLIDGKPDLYFLNNALNYYLYASLLLIFAAYWLYLRELYKVHRKSIRRMTNLIEITLIAGFALLVMKVDNGILFTLGPDTSVYESSNTSFLSAIAPIAMIAICVAAILRFETYHRRKNVLLTYILIPLVAIIIQMFVYGVSLLYFAMMFSIVLMYVNIYLERSTELLKNETKMSRQRAAVMVSQIQPHFMYNALSSIAILCKLDPATAYEATVTFSRYLRGNMDSLKQTEPVPFERELEHLKQYLYIEKLRFADKLNIEYDIQATDFKVPMLSIQPIVENAVKHGVGMKREGGTVTIASKETETGYEIIISDDGVGFDINAPKKDDGRSHIGMENTRKRLRDMCHAEIIITSQPGEGTTARIIIPKETEEDTES